ncbi:MAG: cupredoxin domain-containing protein, partial [Bdellovibrionota bacterium]
MKLQILALALCCSTAAFAATPREVVMKVESIDGKTHWEPERVEAVQGESFKLKFEHNLAAGFPFHGIEIPVLGITKQVNRGQPVEVDVTIPADLKPGEYPIRCQFHA